MNGTNHSPNGKPIEPPLDHDFHSGWGSTYSNRGFIGDDRARRLWEEYAIHPTKVERQYHVLLNEYTESFHSFFHGYWPISMHAHVSDVLIPTTMATLILNTASTSPLVIEDPELSPMLKDDPEPDKIQLFVRELLGWSDAHYTLPNFAIVEGIYGGAFGPLAHASKEWEYNIIGTGPRPFVINRNDFFPERLLERLTLAKQQGCVAVVVDLVSTADGSTLSPEHFRLLRVCCDKARLFLIVDEAMTAIRCGAPWSCQRAEYLSGDETLEPDLVSFGKGMGVSGVAVNFNGLMMRRLGFQKREQELQSIRFWRALVSRPVPTPVLIEALGILNLARSDDWPARSEQIGNAVREFIHDFTGIDPDKKEVVRGLGAMIAVDRDISMQFRVMAAVRRRCPWVRWLPKLDSAAVDRQALETYVVGLQSKAHRQALASEAEKQGTMPLWCFVCGIDATEPDWCRTCFLGTCGHEDCAAGFHAHSCL